MQSSAKDRKKSARRIIALAVLVCFIVFSATAAVFTIEHEHHECTGSHCDICFQLHQIQQIIKNMLPVSAALALGVAALALSDLCLYTKENKPTKTLVSLSVQMNN